MSTPFANATAAYGAAQQLISGTGAGAAPARAAATGGPDFAQLVAEQVGSVLETGARSDRMAMEMVDGRANVVDVITSIAETEIAIESMVAVRDRVIAAYEEIMRMPI